MATPDRMIEAGAWMLEQGHRVLLKATGGRFPRAVLGMEPVELHTTGRKSGLRRSTMLTAPVREGDRVVLVASKGGHSDHPDWYKNLSAHPDVEITVQGRTIAVRARTATPEEKAELWPRIVAAYQGYAGYQRNTDRDIPVVICEPR
ncbi:MAG TPA: nitroreductase family deazaflavin-dependent oxidoreductase [Acidimicrobiales bacterium]|nr:nitroreductase family deazaflavin-dependent oxidoreductase [Acidimicrobiales bacterium]